MLKPSSQANQGSKPGGQGGDGNKGGGANAIRMLSELKLLRWIQEDLNRRFQQLADIADPAERRARQEELSGQQGQLADVAFRLSKPLEGNPEDDPDKLPDLAAANPAGPESPPSHERSKTRCYPLTENRDANAQDDSIDSARGTLCPRCAVMRRIDALAGSDQR